MSFSKYHKRVASDGPDDPSDQAKEPGKRTSTRDLSRRAKLCNVARSIDL